MQSIALPDWFVWCIFRTSKCTGFHLQGWCSIRFHLRPLLFMCSLLMISSCWRISFITVLWSFFIFLSKLLPVIHRNFTQDKHTKYNNKKHNVILAVYFPWSCFSLMKYNYLVTCDHTTVPISQFNSLETRWLIVFCFTFLSDSSNGHFQRALKQYWTRVWALMFFVNNSYIEIW